MPDTDEAADEGGTGMETGEMKAMLARSRRAPINCALAAGDPKTGGLGLLMMNKVTPPKALLKLLQKQFPKCRTPCFGTASVDMDTDPKQVNFQLNKKIPGLDRRVRKTLKGTGFTKVSFSSGGGGDQ